MGPGLDQLLQGGGGGSDTAGLTNNQVRDRVMAVRKSALDRFGEAALMGSHLNILLRNQGDWSDGEAKQGREYLAALETLNKAQQANKGKIGTHDNNAASYTAVGSNIIINGPKYGPGLNDLISSGNPILKDLAKLYILLVAPMLTGLDKFLNFPGLKQLRNALGIPTIGGSQMTAHVQAIEAAARAEGCRAVKRGNGVIGIIDKNGRPADPETVERINNAARNEAVGRGYTVTATALPYDFATTISARAVTPSASGAAKISAAAGPSASPSSSGSGASGSATPSSSTSPSSSGSGAPGSATPSSSASPSSSGSGAPGSVTPSSSASPSSSGSGKAGSGSPRSAGSSAATGAGASRAPAVPASAGAAPPVGAVPVPLGAAAPHVGAIPVPLGGAVPSAPPGVATPSAASPAAGLAGPSRSRSGSDASNPGSVAGTDSDLDSDRDSIGSPMSGDTTPLASHSAGARRSPAPGTGPATPGVK